MPLYENNSLDPINVYDGLTQFARVNSFGRTSAIEADALAGAVNIDLDQSAPRPRRGIERVGGAYAPEERVQGLGYLDTASPSILQRLLSIVDQVPYAWDGATWATLSDYTPPTASQRVCMASLVDKLFLATPNYNLRSWDGTAFVDLGTGGDDQPKQYGIICTFDFRVFGAGIPDLPDTLECSDILDATIWKKLKNSSRVGNGESDPITALCGWQNHQLIIGKRNSIWVATTDPTQAPADWSMSRIVPDVGCVAHATMCQVGNDIYWLAEDGIRSLQFTLQGLTMGVSEPISRPIQDVIDAINWPAIGKASAIYWRNRYILSVPLGTATEPDTILVYNTITKGWCGTWTGWNATELLATYFGGEKRLVMGRVDGTVGQWMDYVKELLEGEPNFQDFEVDYESYFDTRAVMCQEPISPKQGFAAEVEFWKSVEDASVYVSLDGEGWELFWSGPTQNPDGSYVGDPLPWTLGSRGYWRIARDLGRFGSWREIQFRIYCSGGKVQVRSIYIAARPEKFEEEIN